MLYGQGRDGDFFLPSCVNRAQQDKEASVNLESICETECGWAQAEG